MATVRTLDALEGTPHANVFPGSEPTTIRLQLAAGERIDPHDHPDRNVVVSVLEGAIDLRLGSEVYELEAGDVARFDGAQQVSPVATADSTALIVLAKKPEWSDGAEAGGDESST
ncbi:cupin domain-containing protein [Halopenitus sp. H-Gu1]|uniref:cupin domain-containing protein n=1 Tax=Halopenitus sp. H-Gu1 TaxID=3242697 RepID=UPI00359F0BE6